MPRQLVHPLVRRLIGARAAALVVLPLAVAPMPAQGEEADWAPTAVPWRAVCAPFAATLDELQRRHGERLLFEAATVEGFRLLVLVAPDGSYSIAAELRGAPSAPHALCLISVGSGFAPVGRGTRLPAAPPVPLPDRRS